MPQCVGRPNSSSETFLEDHAGSGTFWHMPINTWSGRALAGFWLKSSLQLALGEATKAHLAGQVFGVAIAPGIFVAGSRATMATRTTRMRPLDHNKPLEILRVVEELDARNNDEGGLGGRELEQNIEALDKERDEVRFLGHLAR